MSNRSRDGLCSLDACELAGVADELESKGPEATIAWALETFGDGLAIATGFGAEGVVLIDMAARLHPAPRVFFVDTGFLFPETYELRRRLEQRYAIEIAAVEPELTPDRQEDVFGPRLWRFDPDLCCAMRKVDPLVEHLRDREAWATAIRRDQTPARAAARVVEWDDRFGLVKVNPLASWAREQVWDYLFEHRIPYNPLHDRGYPSIGCTHCTRAVRPGEPERAGRWSGHEKTECGLHSKEDV
jgi:phosphoadenosine phosphosulfate reductase